MLVIANTAESLAIFVGVKSDSHMLLVKELWDWSCLYNAVDSPE